MSVLYSRCIGQTCTLPRPAKRRCLSSQRPRPPYRILFFGADKFSCVTLEALYDARKDLIQHVVVVTPPDQRTGRRLKDVHRPPLRLLAESLSLPTIALPPTLLKDWDPPSDFLEPSPSSLLVTASFGHLLPTSLLSHFEPLNTLNLHPSLLPQYRGAAPIQWGIINGDADSNWKCDDGIGSTITRGMGVTVQELSRDKFDRGRLLGQERVVVPEYCDFLELETILARAGGQLLTRILRDLPTFQDLARPQDGSLATLAPKLTKRHARIDWTRQSNVDLTRLQRGVGHQYPLWTTLSTSAASAPASTSPPPPTRPSSPPVPLPNSVAAAAAVVPPSPPLSPPPRPSQPQQLQLVLSYAGPRALPRSAVPASLSSSPSCRVPPPRVGTVFFSARDKSVYVTTCRAPRDDVGSSGQQGAAEEEDERDDLVDVVRVEKVKKEGGKWVQAREWWNGISSVLSSSSSSSSVKASDDSSSSTSKSGWIQFE